MRVGLGMILLVAACGGGGGDKPAIDAPKSVGTVDAPSGTPVDASPDFTPLIGRSWSLQAGQLDTYECTRKTLTQDTYIAAFHADAPLGTHHTVLTISSTPSDPDGDYDCSAGALDYQMLFASGVGTNDFAFPDGVGIKVPAGSQLNLNLHLFDATDNPLTGTTTISGKLLPAAPAQLAEMVFSGTFNIDIPSTGQPVTATGGCTLSADANIIGLWPHMHQTAIHQTVTVTPKGSAMASPILDVAYEFAEQKSYPDAPPIAVHTGDTIGTTCTYVNNTGSTVMFGESSLDEMCFTGIYRYPAQNQGLFSCTTGTQKL